MSTTAQADAAHQAELAREAEQRRQAELARERAAAAAHQREEEAHARQEHERQVAAQNAHDHDVHAKLGGTSAVAAHDASATQQPAKPKPPSDPAIHKEFDALAKKDGNNKDKLAQDASNLMNQHSRDMGSGAVKEFEQIDIDAAKHGVLDKTLDQGYDGFRNSRAADGVIQAIHDGQLSGPDTMKSLMTDGKNTMSQQTARYVAQDAAAQVNTAKKDLENKTASKDKLDQRLAAELAKIGPGITDQQRDQYVSAFKQKNNYGKLEADIDKSATQLDTTLMREKPTLDVMMKEGGPKVDGDTYPAIPGEGPLSQKDLVNTTAGALKDLAGTNKAGDALKMTASTLTDPALTKQMAKADPDGFKQSMNAIAEEALPRYGKQLMDAAAQAKLKSAGKGAKPEGNDKETAGVFEQLKSVLEPFQQAHEAIGASSKLTDAYKAVQEASTGKLEALQKLGVSWETEKATGAERGFAALGLVLGGGDLATGGTKGFEDTLKAFQGSADGIKTLGGSFEAMKYVGGAAAEGGELAGRFAPAAGAVLSAIAAGKDLKDVLNAKNAGDGIGSGVALAGDLLSTIGGGLEATGVGIVPGALLNAAGTIVSLLGGGIKALFGGGGQSPDDESKQLLTKNLHMSSQTAGGLVGAEPGILQRLQQKGMNPGQVDDIVTNYGGITNGNDPYALLEVEDVQHAFGIKDQNFDAMLHTIGPDWQKGLGRGLSAQDSFEHFLNFQENANGRHEADYYAKQAGPIGSAKYEQTWGDLMVGNNRVLEADLKPLETEPGTYKPWP